MGVGNSDVGNGAVDDLSLLAGKHDLRLPAWGPYTKRYMGVSHIPDVAAGLRFDLSVFPGLYRRNVSIPNVMYESGYHLWEAAPDLSYYRIRSELVWKDQLFCDIDFCRLDDEAVLIRCACANRTAEPQNLALHYMASLHFPPLTIYSPEPIKPSAVRLPEHGIWIDALAYQNIHFAGFDARATLSPDGKRRAEVRDHGFVDGQGLGQGFAATAGDAVSYRVSLPQAVPAAALILRFRTRRGETARLALSGAAAADLALSSNGAFAGRIVPLGDLSAGSHTLAFISTGGAAVELDGMAVVPASAAGDVRFEPVVWNATPQRSAGPRPDTLILKYEQATPHYGLAWGFSPSVVREFLCDDLDSFMRQMVHEHVQTTLRGAGDGHFSNVFMRPIVLEPGAERVIYGMACCGEQESVSRRLAAFDPQSPACERTHAAARARAVNLRPNPAGEPYLFSQERMAATVLTNVVYPVRTRATWIRHNTPGRWWDCLYTWDSGFIGLGLLELDTRRAIDCLNAYMTEPGERDAAFIHHGSPVPTQFYLFHELWQRTRSSQLLTHFYPRLQQYHRFLAGRLGSSTTRSLSSNLLKTWDYFYNSGGWDDYPPQVYVHRQGLEASVAPVVNTTHAILTARILRMAALALGEPVAEYDEDIAAFSHALQAYAWDEESGYFGYVRHDPAGRPQGILRHDSGANYDMGLDGAYPLLAGICTPEQERRLLAALASERHLWCRCGISTVDQSAPYFRGDGYWNGAVWMPHQWLFWRALLDMGQAEQAFRIAQTALDVWRREVEASYHCFEHFVVQTGRGAGWHQFGGLSSPVLNWFGAYHRPGRLTTGLHAWVDDLQLGTGNRSLRARITFFGQARQRPVVIAALETETRPIAFWNGLPALVHQRYPGVLEITLPTGAGRGELIVGQDAAP